MSHQISVSKALQGASPHVNAEDRAKVLIWLDQSHKEFWASIDGISDEQWMWKPAPGIWSVGETAEHILLAETVIFGHVQKALASPVIPDWQERTQGKTELIERLILSRDAKAKAPGPTVPREGLTRAQVSERFEEQRDDIAKFAADTEIALHQHTADHPFPAFGTLSAYQWLIMVPLHTLRHNKQIAEVKASPGYPK